MSLQDWYPLALSRDIAPGTSAGTRVEGHEFVVWRDSKGKAHVWEDRCPHRGMKMSFGFVRGDHIACLYHGWEYDTEGQCRNIPAHPDLKVPETIKIPRFAITEAGGMIWGCFNEVDGDLPPAPVLPTATTPLRSLFIVCPARLVPGLIASTTFEDKAPQVISKSARILDIRLGDIDLIAALQDVASGESALHLCAIGPVETGLLKSLSLWADQLRRDLETAASNTTSAEIAA